MLVTISLLSSQSVRSQFINQSVSQSVSQFVLVCLSVSLSFEHTRLRAIGLVLMRTPFTIMELSLESLESELSLEKNCAEEEEEDEQEGRLKRRARVKRMLFL